MSVQVVCFSILAGLFFPAFAQASLTAEQQLAIAQARAAGVPVKTVEIQHEGQLRTIVIMGDRHDNGKAAALELTKSFPLRVLEGYSGPGHSPGMMERVQNAFVAKLTEWYAAKAAATGAQMSSIVLTNHRGFFMAADGTVFYQRLKIGVLSEDEFTPDAENLAQVTAQQGDGEAEFLESMNEYVARARVAYATLISESREIMKKQEPGWTSEYTMTGSRNRADLTVRQYYEYNLPGEVGDLGIWAGTRARLCTDLTCSTGVVSTRDLRITNSTFAYLTAFPEHAAILVMVGQDHLPVLCETFLNWPEVKKLYLLQ